MFSFKYKNVKWLSVYNFCIWCLTPLLLIHLLLRIIQKKEDRLRFKEKFGVSSVLRMKGKLIWIHVASLGEAISTFKFIDRLLFEDKELNCLLTSGTVNSARLITNKFSDNKRVKHQYIPFDHELFLKRFLSFWQPKLLILFESELWPNLIRFAEERIPVLLVNARLSHKSFKKWQQFHFLIKEILMKFKIIFPQSIMDFNKYQSLGANHLKLIGNIKFANDTHKGELENSIKNAFREKIVFLAASTHENEEIEIIKIYNNLKTLHSNLLLILAPRHPSRVAYIIDLLNKFNNHTILRSKMSGPLKEVLIIDTIGELTNFYELADLIFVGGSMVDIGGHNPLEAAKLGKLVYMGPFYHKCIEIVEKLKNYDILKIVNNWQELASEISKNLETKLYIKNNQTVSEIIERDGKRIIDDYILEIKKYL